MLISELEAKLMAIREEHGDLPVTSYDDTNEYLLYEDSINVEEGKYIIRPYSYDFDETKYEYGKYLSIG